MNNFYGFTIRDIDPQLGDKLGVRSTVEETNPVKPAPTPGASQATAVVTQTFGIHPTIAWMLVMVGVLVVLGVLPGNPFK